MAKALRLQARDRGDVEILSALAQDAVIRVADLRYQQKSRQFACRMSRFRWEEKPGFLRRKPERVAAMLRADYVDHAAFAGIDPKATEAVLELLALRLIGADDDRFVLELIFAGGAAIRLDLECVELTLEDVAQPWPARMRPRHGRR